MMNNLNVDPTNRILDIRRVIARIILRSRTRRAIVFAAGFDRSLVKSVHEIVRCGPHSSVGHFSLATTTSQGKTREMQELTPRRKRKMFVPHHSPQCLRVPFDARDPEERCLVSQPHGGGDWAHPFSEAEGFEGG
jgi:hypothetical protein